MLSPQHSNTQDEWRGNGRLTICEIATLATNPPFLVTTVIIIIIIIIDIMPADIIICLMMSSEAGAVSTVRRYICYIVEDEDVNKK